MKNIKFRAWQKYHKKMVEVTSISFGNNGEINGVSTFVENQAPQRVTYKDGLGGFFLSDERGMVLELMQSTGLKDKNGVEIFEGDIVKFGGNKYAITFTEGGFGVERIYQTGEKTIKVHEPLWNLIIDGCEVIGNIYENNDLLEVTV